jgi:hypothetical protein
MWHVNAHLEEFPVGRFGAVGRKLGQQCPGAAPGVSHPCKDPILLRLSTPPLTETGLSLRCCSRRGNSASDRCEPRIFTFRKDWPNM